MRKETKVLWEKMDDITKRSISSNAPLRNIKGYQKVDDDLILIDNELFMLYNTTLYDTTINCSNDSVEMQNEDYISFSIDDLTGYIIVKEYHVEFCNNYIEKFYMTYPRKLTCKKLQILNVFLSNLNYKFQKKEYLPLDIIENMGIQSIAFAQGWESFLIF